MSTPRLFEERLTHSGEELTRQRIDMLVDETLVVEAKATAMLDKSASRQVYNYLCATRLQVGLLLHFGPAPAFYRLIRTRPGQHHPKGRDEMRWVIHGGCLPRPGLTAASPTSPP